MKSAARIRTQNDQARWRTWTEVAQHWSGRSHLFGGRGHRRQQRDARAGQGSVSRGSMSEMRLQKPRPRPPRPPGPLVESRLRTSLRVAPFSVGG
eukprot:1203560-Pyramimonas_sp.AAC.1